MKILKSEICENLKHLKKVVQPKDSDYASGILVKKGKLIASNQELTVIASLNKDTGEEFILPQTVIPFIESLPEGMVELDVTKKYILISNDNCENRVAAIDISEFPQVPEYDDTFEEFNYTGKNFKDAVQSVWHACNPACGKGAMQGVLFESNGALLNIVACDGYRMAWEKLSCSYDFKMSIPKATLQKVLSLMDDEDEVVLMSSKRSNRAVIKTGVFTVFTRLYDGNFLDYKNMFKEDSNAMKIKINRTALLSCINRCSISKVASSINNPAILNDAENGIRICLDSATASFNEFVPAEYKGENIKLGFNPTYMIEALKALRTEFVYLEYKNAVSPLILREDNAPLAQIIVPMRYPGM